MTPSPTHTVTVASRESALAQAQATAVISQLQASGQAFSLKTFTTLGDTLLQAKLSDLGGDKGLFVKELEQALLSQDADLAIHSLKDMPSHTPQGLTLLAWGPRADARDALVGRMPSDTLENLPHGAIIGTSSLRRSAQLALLRPDITFSNIRGNVYTRLAKLDATDSPYHAIILACAGLNRLGLQHRISQILDPVTTCIPAPGQGILALQYRTNDERMEDLLSPLQDPTVEAIALAERTVMTSLTLGCHSPMGAYAYCPTGQYKQLQLYAIVFTDNRQYKTLNQKFIINENLEQAVATACTIHLK
jgi:hydroxymethylbilane synthase